MYEDSGLLDVGGDPDGQPAVYLHGGPGGAPTGQGWRRFFDPSVRDRAAREWVAWDHAQMGNPPAPKYDDPAVRLASARLITHYWRNAAFLEEDQLLRPRRSSPSSTPGTATAGRPRMRSPLP